jgi:hypothetical protein
VRCIGPDSLRRHSAWTSWYAHPILDRRIDRDPHSARGTSAQVDAPKARPPLRVQCSLAGGDRWALTRLLLVLQTSGRTAGYRVHRLLQQEAPDAREEVSGQTITLDKFIKCGRQRKGSEVRVN